MMKRQRKPARYATVFESPRGAGAVVASGRGLVELLMPVAGRNVAEATEAVRTLYPGVEGENALTRRAAGLLEEYFAGNRVAFDLPVDDGSFTEFERDVYRLVAAIPPGRVMTYGEVAAAIGRPRAARGVGSAMAANPLPIIIPCHRVVGGGGTLTGYSAPGGVKTKQELLVMEGVGVTGNGRVKREEPE
jgi:methylated-DNA-[protein]-cysteine S-methyltransferase